MTADEQRSTLGMDWDVFISHASEDKKDVARPLTERLRHLGFRVWLDENELTIGDSLRQKIDQGLARSRYGIVILSEAFFEKKWPARELDGLLARESSHDNVILPVWHRIDSDFVRTYSPTLAGTFAALTMHGLDMVVQEIVRVLRPADPNGRPELRPSKGLLGAKEAVLTSEPQSNVRESGYSLWLERLDSLRQTGVRLTITPIIPRNFSRHEFAIEAIDKDAEELRLSKIGTIHSDVVLPLGRVVDVLSTGDSEARTLVLDGRLQWISPSCRWRFFPERPATPDEQELGFFKRFLTQMYARLGGCG